jgi:hypothetical protein
VIRILFAVALIGVALPAWAHDDQDNVGRQWAIYAVVGAGTPIGVAGFEAVHRFGPEFEIAAGFGTGFAAVSVQKNPGFGQVVQWAAMPRLRLGDRRDAFLAGLGLSGGEYGEVSWLEGACNQDPQACHPTHYVVWANLEVGGEHWSAGGLALRYFVGYGHGLAAGTSYNIPYFGVGLGYAF